MTVDKRFPALTLLFGIASGIACNRPDQTPAPATPAAKVAAKVPEAALTTVTLTAESEARLGIETVAVEQRGVTRSRVVGGEVMAAGGSESTITAPFAGTLEAAGNAPSPGASVSKGATIFRLVPLAATERDSRIEAERAVTDAAGRQDLAAKRSDRAATLAKDGSGSRRAAEEAQADLVTANAALKAARDRLSVASSGVTISGAIALGAPYSAMVRAVHAGPGQTVAAGAALVELVRLDTVWIRVPLFAGDLAEIDRKAAGRIMPLGASDTTPGIAANPVAAPPSADAPTAGVDLYYAVANASGLLRPGQRVSVRVALVSEAKSLVVPQAAILHDAFGGTWVYESRGDHVFIRRRVSVVDVVARMAVLDQGPAPGTRIVTAGAAELFGTEFGVGK